MNQTKLPSDHLVIFIFVITMNNNEILVKYFNKLWKRWGCMDLIMLHGHVVDDLVNND